MKRHGKRKAIVADELCSYGAAIKKISNVGIDETGR